MVLWAHARHTATPTTVLCHGETFGDVLEKRQAHWQQVASSWAAPGWMGPREITARRKGPSGSGCCCLGWGTEGLKTTSRRERCSEPSPAGLCISLDLEEKRTLPNLGNLSRI